MHATYDSDPEHDLSSILLRLQLQSKMRPQLGSVNIYSCSGCWVRRLLLETCYLEGGSSLANYFRGYLFIYYFLGGEVPLDSYLPFVAMKRTADARYILALGQFIVPDEGRRGYGLFSVLVVLLWGRCDHL